MNRDSKTRLILKYITFMKVAEKLATLSYDEKHQVGSLLVKNDFSDIHAIGYNGNYSGGPNTRDSMEHGMSGFLCAEENMLLNTALNKEVISEHYTAFVTMTPCWKCAKRLVNSGVKNVIFLKDYVNCGPTMDIFNSVNVKCARLDEKISNLFLDITDIPKRFMKEYDDFVYGFSISTKSVKRDFVRSLLLEDINRIFETNDKLTTKKEIEKEIKSLEITDNIDEQEYSEHLYKVLYSIL